MFATQGQVSSGLRIQTAADNAAYWSIATTMKSDNKALTAVSDALDLGAAKTDVAYAGMDAAIGVVSEFKAKLVAAKEPGVDKNKIQKELDQLKQQLLSISTSAIFNGQNWLSTDIADIYDAAQNRTSVISAFVRASNHSVNVQTADVDLSAISLFNTTGGGALEKDERSPGTIGGLRDTIYDFAPHGSTSGNGLGYDFSGPLTFVDDSTAITFDLTLDADDPATTTSPQSGATFSFTINRSLVDLVYPSLNGVISTSNQMREVLREAIGAVTYVGTMSGSPDKMMVHTRENSARGSSYAMSNVLSTLAGSATGGLVNSVATNYGSRAYTYSIFDTTFRIHPETEVYIPINENGNLHTITIDQAMVNAALGITDGVVATKSDFVNLMNFAFDANNIAITASGLGAGLIRYDLDESVHKDAGNKTEVGVFGASDNMGPLPDFGILDVDITASGANLDNYIYGVETMLLKITNGAATLGSLQSRIDMQADFASDLMDTIDKGIGRLVDADLNEASTRLKALQTQEQLGIQALQIANSNSENILSLFR